MSTNKEQTFLFYDLETGDINVETTRVSQFSSIRTDKDFNIIEEKNFYCEPLLDYIPSPTACAITQVTPFDIVEMKKTNPEKVLTEYELYSMLNKDFNVEGTCTLGFNTLRYDDEIVRRGFYRNLFPVYDREFKNDCSRFDMFPLIKMFAKLYPESFKVPVINNRKSFKLEALAKENGFVVNDGAYHDALTDVRATIFLAKKVKETNKNFWDLSMFSKNKNNLFEYITVNKNQPFLLENNYLGAARDFTTYVKVLSTHPIDKNKFIAIDLENENAVNNLLKAKTSDDLKNVYNFKQSGLIEIECNKFPSIISVNDFEKINVKNPNLSKYQEVIEKLNDNKITDILYDKYNRPYNNKKVEPNTNPDFHIYSGFPSKTDLFRFSEFHNDLSIGNLDKYLEEHVDFDDPRYGELAKNVIKRNFLNKLTDPKYNELKSEWGKRNIFIYNNQYVEEYSDKNKVIPLSKEEIIESVYQMSNEAKNDNEKEVLERYKKSINYFFAESKKLYDNIQKEENEEKNTKKKFKI